MNLTNPFSKVDFGVSSDDAIWQGEFKIHFEENARVMGFAMQQLDCRANCNQSNIFWTNFPKEYTKSERPSSWADITVPILGDYVDYMKESCPDVKRAVSIDKASILCSSLNTPSVEHEEVQSIILNGVFADLVNGTGIVDNLTITVEDKSGKLEAGPYFVQSRVDGRFSSPPINTVNLEDGKYDVTAKPDSNRYQGWKQHPH